MSSSLAFGGVMLKISALFFIRYSIAFISWLFKASLTLSEDCIICRMFLVSRGLVLSLFFCSWLAGLALRFREFASFSLSEPKLWKDLSPLSDFSDFAYLYSGTTFLKSWISFCGWLASFSALRRSNSLSACLHLNSVSISS